MKASGLWVPASIVVLVTIVIGVWIALTGPGLASVAFDADLHAHQRACNERIEALNKQAGREQAFHLGLALLGAVTTVVGSVFAGKLKKDPERRVAAIIAAVGAFVSLAGKMLPDGGRHERTAFLANQHCILADKTASQLASLAGEPRAK